ncbi:MAG: hypothetical protein Q9220_004233 [cf. Caloplaca sp. 1 TL-2023]
MQELLRQVSLALSTVDTADPISDCPVSVLALLPSQPDALITLAHSKLHAYPFDSVPVCWRRLYTDASIAKAVALIQHALVTPDGAESTTQVHQEAKRRRTEPPISKNGEIDDEWVDEVVRTLDMASIMAGAAGRTDMVEQLLSALQQSLRQDEPLQVKRQKLHGRAGSFPTLHSEQSSQVPVIRFPLQSCDAPSMHAFERHMQTAQPLRISEALTHWPAMHERPWSSPSYLLERTFGGKRLIPVEIGRSYTDPGWGQSIITFKQFMESYMLSIDAVHGKLGYLAQHDLFSQIPSLRNDIAIPDYCYTVPPPTEASNVVSVGRTPPPQLEEPLLNAWFGPAGTVSPLHTDPYHNILCQVVGKKYIRLYDPDQTAKLYPKGIEEGGVNMSNTSNVDAEGPADKIEAEFPLFQQAAYVETILSEGECLYIPVGWWHYVRSLSVSFSVSFWWN